MQKSGFAVLKPVRYRLFNTSAVRRSSWSPGPAPPRLPKEEQEIFEKLLKQSTGAFSTPRAEEPQQEDLLQSSTSSDAETAKLDPAQEQVKRTRAIPIRINQSPQSGPTQEASDVASQSSELPPNQSSPQPTVKTGDGAELHPNIRRGAPPEFEGDVNPKTGETGGPKNEPLRWGYTGDWSYNGRVTDF